jgi:hypothetical protein
MTNYNWFDKLTILSPVEGQYPNSNELKTFILLLRYI